MGFLFHHQMIILSMIVLKMTHLVFIGLLTKLGIWLRLYSRVSNNRTCTIIFFRLNFPSVRSLIGTVRLFILDKISPLYVYFALYDYLFWTFFPNFFSKSKEVLNIWIHKNVRIKSNCALCCFKNQCFTHSNFWWCRRRIKNILLSKKRN